VANAGARAFLDHIRTDGATMSSQAHGEHEMRHLPDPTEHERWRLHQALADLAWAIWWGFLYAVRALARNAVTISTTLAMILFASYWAITIFWAVLDRQNR
jgi:hypothetical protein